MTDQNAPVNNDLPKEEVPSPAPAEELDPIEPEREGPRPEYTKKQRVLALLGAIFVIIVTLMYTYSIATGDLFFR